MGSVRFIVPALVVTMTIAQAEEPQNGSVAAPPDLIICSADDEDGSTKRKLHFWLAYTAQDFGDSSIRYAMPMFGLFPELPDPVRLIFDGSGRLTRFALPDGVAGPDCETGVTLNELEKRGQAIRLR